MAAIGRSSGQRKRTMVSRPAAQPVAVAFQKDDTQWYRARFAGFTQDRAKSTCAELKRMSFDCVVMRAN